MPGFLRWGRTTSGHVEHHQCLLAPPLSQAVGDGHAEAEGPLSL
jgi:hypothetical protein